MSTPVWPGKAADRGVPSTRRLGAGDRAVRGCAKWDVIHAALTMECAWQAPTRGRFDGETSHPALFDACVTEPGSPDYVPARTGQCYWKRLAVTAVTRTIPQCRCPVEPP